MKIDYLITKTINLLILLLFFKMLTNEESTVAGLLLGTIIGLTVLILIIFPIGYINLNHTFQVNAMIIDNHIYETESGNTRINIKVSFPCIGYDGMPLDNNCTTETWIIDTIYINYDDSDTVNIHDFDIGNSIDVWTNVRNGNTYTSNSSEDFYFILYFLISMYTVTLLLCCCWGILVSCRIFPEYRRKRNNRLKQNNTRKYNPPDKNLAHRVEMNQI